MKPRYKHARPLPATTKAVTVRLSREQYAELKAFCLGRDVTIRDVLRAALVNLPTQKK